MKINEILNEQQINELGWGDVKAGAAKAAQGIKTGYNKLQGGIAGAKAGLAQAKGSQEIDQAANYWFDRWNKEVVAGNPAAVNNPAILQQFATKVASRLGGKVPTPPPQLNPATTKAYLKQVIGLDVSAGTAGNGTTPAPAAGNGNTNGTTGATAPGKIIMPTNVGGGARPNTQPAAGQTTEPAAPSLAPGVSS